MIIILLLLISQVYGNFINVYSPSIITFNYSNINSYSLSMGLNDDYFRESSVLPNHNGLFSIGINPGKYNINTNTKDVFNHINYDYNIETGKILKTNSKLKNYLETIDIFHSNTYIYIKRSNVILQK